MFGDYDVDRNGVVTNKNTGKVLNQWTNKWGYKLVTLYINKKRKHMQVHRMVAIKFLGYMEGMVVNHKDLNKENNKLENLEWCTAKENIQHAAKAGVMNGKGVTILEGKKHRDISYYETTPVERRDFKRACSARDLNFDDFIEINSSEKTKSGNIKKFYIAKELHNEK